MRGKDFTQYNLLQNLKENMKIEIFSNWMYSNIKNYLILQNIVADNQRKILNNMKKRRKKKIQI